MFAGGYCLSESNVESNGLINSGPEAGQVAAWLKKRSNFIFLSRKFIRIFQSCTYHLGTVLKVFDRTGGAHRLVRLNIGPRVVL